MEWSGVGEKKVSGYLKGALASLASTPPHVVPKNCTQEIPQAVSSITPKTSRQPLNRCGILTSHLYQTIPCPVETKNKSHVGPGQLWVEQDFSLPWLSMRQIGILTTAACTRTQCRRNEPTSQKCCTLVVFLSFNPLLYIIFSDSETNNPEKENQQALHLN